MAKPFKTMTATELSAQLNDNNMLLIDCRQLQDYQKGHIESAMHSHDNLIESLLKKADKDKKIVIYCYHGHSSEHLAELFGSFGFKDVYSVIGGYESWQSFTSNATL